MAAVLVAAQVHAAPRAVVDPMRVVLGRDAQVRIQLQGLDPDLPVVTAASSGALLPGEGPGKFVWTPPQIRYPTVAFLVFWQPSAPRAEPLVVEVPLVGRTVLELDTEPGADVRIRVGTETFGPEKANARGRVAVPVEVPPGVRTAEAVATAQGRQTTRTLPLQVPGDVPFAAAIGPEPLSIAEGGWIVVAKDAAVGPERIEVQVENGLAVAAGSSGSTAIYRVKPAAGSGGTRVRATVQVRGAEGPVTLEADVVEGAPPGPAPANDRALAGAMQAGGYLGGGENRGWLAELSVAVPTPLWDRRIAAELSVGLRRQKFAGQVPGVGTVETSLWTVPLAMGGRARLWEWGALGLHARAGLGLAPFRHALSAGLLSDAIETGIAFHGFGALQGTWRLGGLELLAEARAELSTVRTPRVSAQPGGLGLGLGARWALPW